MYIQEYPNQRTSYKLLLYFKNRYFGEPHEVDKKFRGNTTLDCTNEKVEKQVSEFYGDNGLYTTLMDEAESIGIADLGNLMVSFSKV